MTVLVHTLARWREADAPFNGTDLPETRGSKLLPVVVRQESAKQLRV